MRELAIADLNFHDAWLLGLVYDHLQRSVSLSMLSFLHRDERAVRVRLEFTGVAFLLATDVEPWGPSQYLYSATQDDRLPLTPSEAADWELAEGDRMLHILTQSGDDIYIACRDVAVTVGE